MSNNGEPYTSRGVCTVLGEVCANLPLKSGKAALSYSTDRYYKNWIKDYDNDVEISQEEWVRLRREFEGTRPEEVEIDWNPLWHYGAGYVSYQDAYRGILSARADLIQNYEGGRYTALLDIFGGDEPELIYLFHHSGWNAAYLHIWSFKDERPWLLLERSEEWKALFADSSKNLFTYSIYRTYSEDERFAHFFRTYTNP